MIEKDWEQLKLFTDESMQGTQIQTETWRNLVENLNWVEDGQLKIEFDSK